MLEQLFRFFHRLVGHRAKRHRIESTKGRTKHALVARVADRTA